MKNPLDAAGLRALRRNRGFSLVELIVIIVVIGILSTVIGLSVKSIDESSRLSVASGNALSDLRYAQHTAMTERAEVNFTVSPGSNSYWARFAASTKYPAADYLKSPQNPSANLSVTFNTGNYKGVSISTGYSGTITFNSDGIPYNGASTLNANVTLMTLNGKRSIVLSPSGFANIQ